MKLLLTLFLVVAFSVSIVAQETIQKGHKLHPDAQLIYCKKKVYDKNTTPPMPSIERIAIEYAAQKLYIKFYEQDEELETLINGKTNRIGDWRQVGQKVG